MSAIRRALITLAIMCGLIAGATTPASAAPAAQKQETSTAALQQARGFCFDSKPYGSGLDVGIHLSHCDLQALTNPGMAVILIKAVLGEVPFVGSILNLIETSLSMMKQIDRGNGVYILHSALFNKTYVRAA